MPRQDGQDVVPANAADTPMEPAAIDVELTPDQREVTGLEVIDAAAMGLAFDAPPDPDAEGSVFAALKSSDAMETVRLADLAAAAPRASADRADDDKDGSPAERVAADGSTGGPPSGPGTDDSGVFALVAPESAPAEPPLNAAEPRLSDGESVFDAGAFDDPPEGEFDGESARSAAEGSADCPPELLAADPTDSTDSTDAEPGVLSMETELGPEDRAPAAPAPVAAAPVPPTIPLTSIQILESVLFAAHEPLAPARLGSIVGDVDARSVRKMIEELNRGYAEAGRAFSIEEVAGGWQVFTRPEFNPWLKKLHKARAESKLSQTSLLTLAIVAYKQPIKRVDIEGIRGAACGEVLRSLMDKGLAKIVGREESLGRPLLYGTTKKFLQVFGLGSLKELPKAEELNKP